jgi:flagellar L-ring protein FlgH
MGIARRQGNHMKKAQRLPLLWLLQISAPVLLLCLPAAAGDPGTAAAAAAPDAPLTLGQVMETNGGSLLRAQRQTHVSAALPLGSATDGEPEAPSGSLVSLSFFSVAAPKPKSYKKHDLVTIIALENTVFSANGTTQTTKTQDINSQLNSFIAWSPSSMKLRGIIQGGSTYPQIQNQNEDDYKGTGEADRTDTFSDRFTAEVVDIKPNGTMVLQAIKQIRSDEEMQRLILTGICRVQDVTADNTVLSTQIFDLELTQSHTGAVEDGARRGFLSRLLDTFSPF